MSNFLNSGRFIKARASLPGTEWPRWWELRWQNPLLSWGKGWDWTELIQFFLTGFFLKLNYEDSSALTSVDLQAMSLPPLPNDRSSTWLRMFFTAFRKLDALVGRRFIFQKHCLLFGGNLFFIRKEIPIEKNTKTKGPQKQYHQEHCWEKGQIRVHADHLRWEDQS